MSMLKESAVHTAILGGTFDPMHIGHINVAKHITNWLNLTEITLIPCHIPPHKHVISASAKHRLEMVQLSCREESTLKVDNREIKNTSISYTVDTLMAYKRENPNSTLYFVIGMDSLQTFTTWHKWQEILSLAHLVVCTRPGYEFEKNNLETQQLLAKHFEPSLSKAQQQTSGCILFSPPKNIDISSSNIRSLIQENDLSNIDTMITPVVKSYINSHQLYQKDKILD